ncbi:MutT/NUDIX family protein [Salimicrobium jeotgali]|uniref:MutT/NUDIX family protein n=1 Tax=Salimicrobium jeotgali TaxID=1230341 RepID=K2H4S6_9BACI|nr:NUDIX domain-containing protein [Salimicrobium jeotgali]EKE30875.1 MutT/NUDIX family protein [Salimicrobium jeotgali]MBM7697661.1 8-oxo-dGTP pyrophosphatase MutT (NUDIX family) [Salimicrobium jeotgali]
MSIEPVKKAYGYVIRYRDGKPQVLVFQHPIKEAGIQIPKGTVKIGEDTYDAVIREIKEETGLEKFTVEKLLVDDLWRNDDGAIHNRFFYKINVTEERDQWHYKPTGGGEEEGLMFKFFWISSLSETNLIRGHGDYLSLIFD